MTSYGWIIDKDCDPDESVAAPSNCNATGMTGPRGLDPDIEAALGRGEGRTFRIRDDDGELYYEGRWIGPNWRVFDGRQLDETAFGPLYDFGLPNAGATEILYRENGDNTGKWVQL